MVWYGRTRHSSKKNVSDHTCAVFDAGKPLQNWAKSEGDRKSDPLSGTSHHNENHQTLQFSILLRLQKHLLKNDGDTKFSLFFLYIGNEILPYSEIETSLKFLINKI